MGELAEWLALLPEPQLHRLATNVLGAQPASRVLTERALAQRLSDAEWARGVLEKLGPQAKTAARALLDAAVPVRRADLASLTSDNDGDPLEALEDHGLVVAVKTGPGMPTHVALAPGVAALLRLEKPQAPDPDQLTGAALGSARRRFHLALTLGLLFQHPPRLTRNEAVHSTDLAALAARLAPLGVTQPRLARELSVLTDLGALVGQDGRLVPVPQLALNVTELHLRLALEELASSALPDEAAAAVAMLVQPHRSLSLAHLLNVAQTALLRERADDEDKPHRGARGELVRTLSSLLTLEALVLLDADGHPVSPDSDEVRQKGQELLVMLDPSVAAMLRGEEPKTSVFRTGHVQSSFEIVADAGADPSLVATVAAFSRLARADFAAVMRLERASLRRALNAGLSPALLATALEALSGRPLPPNVAITLADWLRDVQAPKLISASFQTSLNETCRLARARLSATNGD